MHTGVTLLIVVALIAVAKLIGYSLSDALDLSPGVIALVLLAVVYVALSYAVRVIQRRTGTEPSPATKMAVRVGIVWVNLPLIPIMLGPIFIEQWLVDLKSVPVSSALLALGFAMAWAWWSINISLWRRWAAGTGAHPEELQSEGESSSLLWPRGYFLERTEYDNLRKRFKGHDA